MSDERIRNEIQKLKQLVEAIRFNHNIQDGEEFKLTVKPYKELARYKIGITQLTLPARFKMLKTSKTTPKVT